MKRRKMNKPVIPTAIVGVVGVHYVAAELSRRGVIALPTVRNTRGFDLVAVTQDGRKFATIQVKTSLKRIRFWPTGKVPKGQAKNAFYAFVRPAEDKNRLEAYIVPAATVAKTYWQDPNNQWDSWDLAKCPSSDSYKDAWHLIPGVDIV